MKYSIVIVPPEPVFSQLKVIIGKLAKEFNGPIFEPHITLAGNIEMNLPHLEEKLNVLSRIDKLDLKLGEVSFSTTYFQNVFIRVNPTAQLLELNINAKKLFGIENTVFMPHISLLYGNQDMKKREEAASKIKIAPTSFTADSFIVIPATPDPSQWAHVLEVRFKGLPD